MLDLNQVIRELLDYKLELDRAIDALEKALCPPVCSPVIIPPVCSKRGRKSMGAEERLVVSTRIKRYWESRRQAKRLAAAGSD